MRLAISVTCVTASALLVSFSPASWAAQNPQVQDRQQDVQKDAPTRTAKPAVSPVTLTADGKLSLTAPRPRLKAVLEEISARAKLPIVVSDGLADERVSIQLREVPLEEGLRRLLSAYDTFYLFSAADTSQAAIRSIWVYRRGEGWELEPVPPTLRSSPEELEAQLEDPDPGVRSEAYEELIDRQGERALQTILRAFADPDEVVRLGTLSAAINADIEIPASDLHALILGDQSHAVRLTALLAIENRPEAEAIAASVQNDPDEVIRNHAKVILEALHPELPKDEPVRPDPQQRLQQQQR